MDQQQQTLEYFERFAQDWQAKAQVERAYNLIEARNGAVLSSMASRGKPAQRLLDVGCGTGQLVIEAAQRGFDAVGLDFARDMIVQCETNRKAAGVSATFVTESFFDMATPAKPFDVISAQGFIEYISPEQMERFFARCYQFLAPGGAVVVGSRNRLFNAASLNEFTLIEKHLGVLDSLIAEAVSLSSCDSQENAFVALRAHERVHPQPDTHPITGIKVDVRYQYTPSELIMRLRGHRFSPRTIYPIHYHALPTSMKADHPTVHSEFAMLTERLAPRDVRLAPRCSTFVLEVVRN